LSITGMFSKMSSRTATIAEGLSLVTARRVHLLVRDFRDRVRSLDLLLPRCSVGAEGESRHAAPVELVEHACAHLLSNTVAAVGVADRELQRICHRVRVALRNNQAMLAQS